MEGKKKFTYQFDSAHERENFCLQVRQMKMLHSQELDVDNLSVFIGTWNMGEEEIGHVGNELDGGGGG